MFVIFVPRTHKVGDTMDVRINMKPARLTWESPDTLVINGTDRRVIHEQWESIDVEGTATFTFVCGDAEAYA